jgi:hypothetical protein
MTSVATGPFQGLPHHHFAVILADPPWRFQVYSEAIEAALFGRVRS